MLPCDQDVYFLLYLHSVYCALVGLYLSLVILQQLFHRATVKLQHLHLVLQFMFLPRWYRENQNIKLFLTCTDAIYMYKHALYIVCAVIL